MRRFFFRLFLVSLLAAVAAVAAGAWAWHQLHQPFGSGSRTVTVANGTGAGKILEQLEGAGVIADARLARAYLVYHLDDPALRAGEYVFEGELSTPQTIDKLIRGEVVTYPLQLIEGLTRQEVAAAVAEQGFGELDVLLRETGRTDLIADLDPQAIDLEGYLYPDTYQFARGTSEQEIIATLVRTFRQRFEKQVAPLLDGQADPPSVRDLVSLASIIEKEAKLESERPIIAAVYANRLERGIALYADPTVIFALKQLGRWDGNIRRPDLQLDSPYNTYLYPGLPPGPICSPRATSLVAAADPAQVPYLYFVSRNDGSHVFAKTLAEHNRNVEQWQRQYWRRKRAEEKRSK
nr:endolytic murein transglycosylase-like [Nerophis lumbriciformis]